MELSILLLQKILTLLLIVIMGFLSVRKGVVKTEHSSVLSRLCFEWVGPCSIINSFLNSSAGDTMSVFLFVGGVTLGMILLFIGLTFLIRGRFRLNGPEQGSLMFTNSAAMALPMAAALLGSESIIFCTPHMCIQNFFIYTLLPVMMSGSEGEGLLKALLNRNVIAVGIGFLLFIGNIPVPGIILNAITNVAGSISCFYMLMIGMLMGGVNFRNLLNNGRMYLVSLVRLVVYPLIAILILKIFRIPDLMPSAGTGLIVMIMCVSAPVATAVTQMSDLYCNREEAQEAGSINIISTLMCAITMPIMVFIYQIVIGI